MNSESQRLDHLLALLGQASTYQKKIRVLDHTEEVQRVLAFLPSLASHLTRRTEEEEYLLKSVCAIGQGLPLLIPLKHSNPGHFDLLRDLLDQLLAIEQFYAGIGGIVGYQKQIIDLLEEQKKSQIFPNMVVSPPHLPIDISQEQPQTRRAIIEGICQQGQTAELYPVGGTADRLHLIDPSTHDRLPAAFLSFLNYSLLERLIYDVQAREYLHFKLFSRQLITPIAMMTSHIHRNHAQIEQMCERLNWFHRPRGSFMLFTQPSIPSFTREGRWCLQAPLQLLLKPGGHGVIWKLAQQNKVLKWLKEQGKTSILVRQINNPIAGVNHGLLAFMGMKSLANKPFGCASCHRRPDAQEGMHVIKTFQNQSLYRSIFTTIEYCHFKDSSVGTWHPPSQGPSPRSFLANTNLLYLDIDLVIRLVKELPYPGLLINFKKDVHYTDGHMKEEEVARLESTMQNLSDGLPMQTSYPPTEEEFAHFPIYLTMNRRVQTISATKKKSCDGRPMLETPEECYYDFLYNGKELLEGVCQWRMPDLCDKEHFSPSSTPFLFHYHPALGPLYSIIEQKIKGGRLTYGSELQLHIADLFLHQVEVEGSLIIEAENIMGNLNEGERLTYSHRTGQCYLSRVTVHNRGVNWKRYDLAQQQQIPRTESLHIFLKGHSRFIAKDVIFSRPQRIEVEDGVCLIASMKDGEVILRASPLRDQHPFWHYRVQSDHQIRLDSPLFS